MIDLHAIEASFVDETVKGMPGGLGPIPLRDIGCQGWNLLMEDLPLPLAVLKEQALNQNGDWMRRFLAASNARISPHGKTTMSPHLFSRPIDHGSFLISIARVQQLQVALDFGFASVLRPLQLAVRRFIFYGIVGFNRESAFYFFCFGDLVASVNRLATAGRDA